jgi:hypothetical protein
MLRSILFLFAFQSAFANIALWKEELIDTSLTIFGEKLTLALFGETNVYYYGNAIPSIPKIDEIKPTDTSGYGKKREDEKIEDEGKRRTLDYQHVKELINVVYERTVSETELIAYLNTLDQGGTREGVYSSLVLNNEYYKLEGKEMWASEKAQEFALFILEKFCDLEINFKKEVNKYYLKRLVIDKVMNVFELLPTAQAKVYFNILSVDLNRFYPGVLKKKHRSSDNYKLHEMWSSKVPFPFLKSELVVKLHIILNSL